MPRVTTRTRRRAEVKRAMLCSGGCKLAAERDGDNSIRKGETYYTWQQRFGGPQYRHVSCGYPRPSQLSNRKTAVVEDAIQDAQETLAGWALELPADLTVTEIDVDASEIEAALEAVASVAQEVAAEYESSADGMPENLQYGSQAEAMRSVASELEDWASDIEAWTPDETTIELPERSGFEDDGDWESEALSVVEAASDDIRASAEQVLDGMPEYEG